MKTSFLGRNYRTTGDIEIGGKHCDKMNNSLCFMQEKIIRSDIFKKG